MTSVKRASGSGRKLLFRSLGEGRQFADVIDRHAVALDRYAERQEFRSAREKLSGFMPSRLAISAFS